MRRFLHVAHRSDWEQAQRTGEYPIPGGGPFTHGCFPEQLPGVLERFFPGDRSGLVLLEVDPEGLPVRIEAAADGAGDFPHVHAAMPVTALTERGAP